MPNDKPKAATAEIVTLSPLQKLASAIDAAAPVDPLAEYGPQVEQLPLLASEAIEAVFNAAADRLLRAADAMMAAAVKQMTMAQAKAKELRELGRREGRAIGMTAELANELAQRFTAETARATAFRRDVIDRE